jgi:predicted MFS family arabinose efflux permease
MVAGLRYVRHTAALRSAFARAASTLFFGSALMGLLPLYARRTLGAGSTGYGVLIGCLGLGAVAATPLLGLARRHVIPDGLLAVGGAVFATAVSALALSYGLRSAGLAMFLAGVGWMTMMSSLNIAVQQASPAWVRARVLSAYLVVFQGGISVGALVWGSLATRVGVPTAYFVAALGLLASLSLRLWFPLARNAPDLRPSAH